MRACGYSHGIAPLFGLPYYRGDVRGPGFPPRAAYDAQPGVEAKAGDQ